MSQEAMSSICVVVIWEDRCLHSRRLLPLSYLLVLNMTPYTMEYALGLGYQILLHDGLEGAKYVFKGETYSQKSWAAQRHFQSSFQ